MRADSKSVLVLGRRTKQVKDLERLLVENLCRVQVTSNPSGVFKQNKGEDIDFIIMPEFRNRKIDEALFSQLRVFFPTAKLLVLVNRVTREMEVTMRSKGLIFFGSYRRFMQLHQEIIGLASRPGKTSGQQ